MTGKTKSKYDIELPYPDLSLEEHTMFRRGQMRFKSIGKNCKISDKISVYGADSIEIGENVRIDDFCILSSGNNGFLRIGSHIHIAAYVALYGGSGIICEDFTQYGPGTILLSESDDFSGASLIGPCVPMQFKPKYKRGLIHVGRHVTFGARCLVLPKVHLHEGGAIGASTLVTKDTSEWGIFTGIPAKLVVKRDKDAYLAQEKAFLAYYRRENG